MLFRSEERRLMYVGLTRAKEKIYLLFTEQRMIFGSTQANAPSRFLSEIPNELIEEAPRVASGMLGKRHFQKSFHRFPSAPKKTQALPASAPEKEIVPLQPEEVRPGDMVEHAQFGSGLIVAVSGTLATIAFKRAGVKKMMLGVAPLTKV